MFTKNAYLVISQKMVSVTMEGVWDIVKKIRVVSGGLFTPSNGYTQNDSGEVGIYSSFNELLSNHLKQSPYSGSTATTSYNGKKGVLFGSGENAENFDDYNLHGDILTSYNVSQIITNEITDTYAQWTGDYTITNTSGSDFTIREVGVFDYFYNKKGEANTYKYYNYLIERSVLETPITIPANGIGRIVYTIRYTFPTGAVTTDVVSEVTA